MDWIKSKSLVRTCTLQTDDQYTKVRKKWGLDYALLSAPFCEHLSEHDGREIGEGDPWMVVSRR